MDTDHRDLGGVWLACVCGKKIGKRGARVMAWSGDPLLDASRYDNRQQRRLDRQPKCVICGEPIQDEHCYQINDELICAECLNENYRVFTDDYTE